MEILEFWYSPVRLIIPDKAMKKTLMRSLTLRKKSQKLLLTFKN